MKVTTYHEYNSKILFYIGTIREGGAARVMVNLANQFVKTGYQVIFVTNFSAPVEYPLDNKIQRISLEEKESTRNVLVKNISRIFSLRHLIKIHKPQYGIGFMGRNNVRLLLAALWLRTKTIISVRTDPKVEYRGLKGYLIAKVIYRLSDGLVFQTKDAQHFFPSRIQQKSAIIFNPVAERFYQVVHAEASHHIVTCGRLSAEKRHDLLIKAFSCIANKFPTENLLIYGEGNQRAALHKLILELSLQDRVFLMGQNTDVAYILSQAKLFVLPSDYEGMPNALMEALAVGVPSISTDCPCGGPRELIASGHNGLLVPCNDENELVKAMDTMLSCPEPAIQMGKNARQVAQSYKVQVIMRQWKEFMETMV